MILSTYEKSIIDNLFDYILSGNSKIIYVGDEFKGDKVYYIYDKYQ